MGVSASRRLYDERNVAAALEEGSLSIEVVVAEAVPVVGGEQNQRVIESSLLFQDRQNLTGLVVDLLYHRRVMGADPALVGLGELAVIDAVPGQLVALDVEGRGSG